MPRMTELDENHLRTLMSRYREQNPTEFVDLVTQTLFIRVEDESIFALHHKDAEGSVDGTIVIFKGGQVAKWADEALETWMKRLKEYRENTDDE